MRFDWDPDKNELNVRNHGVSFEEAQEAFFDPNALEEYDEEHSTTKEPVSTSWAYPAVGS